MTSGLVFEIQEFSLHDGPGIRTTVFLKGCPLNCSWCHNPEGKLKPPQVMATQLGERTVGRRYSSLELAQYLNKQADVLSAAEGGVTFSGGEPLYQARFVAEVIELLKGTHVTLETCGYGGTTAFHSLAIRSDLVYFDLKLIDPVEHRRYTGCGNEPILRNLRVLDRLEVPFVIRVPLIPGITDTDSNLKAIAETVGRLRGLTRVDLLRYNRLAGAKHKAFGMEFKPDYDETRALNINTVIFAQAGLEVRVV